MPGPNRKSLLSGRRAGRGLGAVALCCALAFAGWTPVVSADPSDPERLRALERSIEERKVRLRAKEREAQALEREARELKRRMIAAAAAVQQREAAVTQTEEHLADLVADEAVVSRQLAEREAAMDATLAALQMLERNRPPALVVQPDAVVDAARSAMLLGTIVPQLHADAVALGTELADLQSLRDAILTSREELLAANESLHLERTRLEALFEEKEAQRRKTLADAATETRAIARASAEARDMRTLIAQIEAEARSRERDATRRQKPEDGPNNTQTGRDEAPERVAARPGPQSTPAAPTPDVRRMPAQGRVILAFGQADGAGGSAKGVLVRTRDNAQVVSPTGGQVAFAGPVRGYGQMLIIAAPGGYHVILAGLHNIYGSEGQALLAGEPVGTMGPETQETTEAETPRRDARELYLEVRYKGLPVDPMKWLAGSRGTVTG